MSVLSCMGESSSIVNSGTACTQSLQIRLRRIVEAGHLLDVEFQRHELLLEGESARAFQALEVTGIEPAFQGDARDISVAYD
jgi:hypothetical protein